MAIRIQNSPTKLRGGYYTPDKVAEYLWEWVEEIHPQSVLEPSAGDGALLKPAMEQNSVADFTAIELIKEEAAKIRQRFKNHANLQVINKDFYNWYIETKQTYDAVIANPPYIKNSYIGKPQQEIKKQILAASKTGIPAYCNSWAAFVIAAIQRLNPCGRIGFVLPVEFLHVDYAKLVRAYLLKKLRKFYIVTFKREVFKSAMQDVVLILGELGEEPTEFKCIESFSSKQIPNWQDVQVSPVPSMEANTWNQIYISGADIEFLNNLKQKQGLKFSQLAKMHKGNATGSNEFFALSTQEVETLQAWPYAELVVPQSKLVEGLVFNKDDYLKQYASTDTKIWLLDFAKINADRDLPPKLQDFIKEGIKQQRIKYTASGKLNVNYEVPLHLDSDMFLTVFAYQTPRLILNNDPVTSLTNLCQGRCVPGTNLKLVTLAFYSSLSLVSLELCGRPHLKGVLELRITGLENSYVLPKLDYQATSFSFDLDQKLAYLNKLLIAQDYQAATDFADQTLIENLGFTFDKQRTQSILSQLRTQRLTKRN